MRQQVSTSTLSDDFANLQETRDKTVQSGDDGLLILGADVDPDIWAPTRDACHVTETTGGKTQQCKYALLNVNRRDPSKLRP